MYVAQITIPFNELTNNIDRIVLEDIFSELHKSQYLVSDNYKFILGFPEASKKHIGTILQVFAKNKDDLIKHIRTEKLYRLITDNCGLSIVDIKDNQFKNIDTYSLKRTKEDGNLPLSRIKRLIKRKTGEVYHMYKEGMSEIEIYNIIKKQRENNRTNDFIRYTSTSLHKATFFIEYIDMEEKSCNLFEMIDNINSFGMNKDIILPKLIF